MKLVGLLAPTLVLRSRRRQTVGSIVSAESDDSTYVNVRLCHYLITDADQTGDP